MAVNKKMQDRLARMQEKMQQYKSSSTQGYWRPEEGENRVRILPEVGGMEFFFQPVGMHQIKSGRSETTSIICPEFTTDGMHSCPICEYSNLLWQQGSKDLAGQYRVRKQFRMNVIVRGGKNEEDSGPFVYTPGVQVFEHITALVSNPEWGDITDIDDGFDIRISRTGKGLDTEYIVQASRMPSSLFNDPKLIEDALGKAVDHSTIVNAIKTREEILEEVDLDGLPEPEEEEEPAPRRRSRVIEEEEEFDEFG